jgi:cyclophilin family peptidyl-prolyl cis-trans isomerase
MTTRAKNPFVFIEVQIGNRVGGRVVFELFSDGTPKTAENFRCLCTGEAPGTNAVAPGQTPKKLSYAPSKIFSIEQGVGFKAGDIVNNDGTGGESKGLMGSDYW